MDEYVSIQLVLTHEHFCELMELTEGRAQMVPGSTAWAGPNATAWMEIGKLEMRSGVIASGDRFPQVEYFIRVSILDRERARRCGVDPEKYQELLHILGLEAPDCD